MYTRTPCKSSAGSAALRRTHLAVLFLIALAAAAWSVAGLAGDVDHGSSAQADVFDGADVDGDGRLSFEEFKDMAAQGEVPGQGLPATEHQAAAMRRFKDEDGNDDGYLSSDEIEAAR